jgi:nucleotide-binding universal stress UspA family protein
VYEEILVPTDGSHAAEAAIEQAIGLAEQYGARIHALYVVDVNAYSTIETGTDVVLSSLEKEGTEAVEAIARAAGDAGVDVTTEVVTGTPYRDILEYADERGVDLIVMGTHGRRGLDRYLLGSVTEKVVRSADVPVLTVRETEEEEE